MVWRTLDNGHDTFYGNNDNDYIWARGGNDKIYGGGGNDYLIGESGVDTIIGGNGNDYINGGSGIDTLRGGSGNDTLEGGTGNDLVDGGSNNDTIRDGGRRDEIYDGSGNDTFVFSKTFGAYDFQRNTIHDWSEADVIQVDAKRFSDLRISSEQGGTQILDFSNGQNQGPSIFLPGVDYNSIDASDFIFA